MPTECNYLNEDADKNSPCETCKHNQERVHYIPDPDPYYLYPSTPYYPSSTANPYYPYYTLYPFYPACLTTSGSYIPVDTVRC